MTEESGLELKTPDSTLNCQWIHRDEIEPNDWNPNDMDEEQADLLVRSILNQGWTQPIVIHSDEEYIIDGEQRWKVSEHPDILTNEELTPEDVPPGYVPVFGITIDENQARISTVQHNRARGELSSDDLIDYFEEFHYDDLLNELSVELGLDTDDVLSIVSDSEDDEFVEELAGSTEPIEDKDTDADGKPLLNEERDSAVYTKSDAPEDADTETISTTMSRDEMEHVLEILGEDNPATVLLEYVRYIQDNDLKETFWKSMDIEEDDSFL